MKKQWQKDGRLWDGTSIVLDDMRIWNPTDEQLIAAGYVEYVPPVHVRTLEQAKQEKKWAIEGYDSSSEVNGFVIVLPSQGDGMEDTEVETWIDRETRADYKNSLDAAELLGRTEVTPVFNGMALTIPVTMAKMALAQIQLYANQCFNVTEQHKATVDALETIEAVDAYDYETGYPDKLRFEVPLANAEGVVADEQG